MSAGRPPRSFFDSNILVYSDDASEPVKQHIVIELIQQHRVYRTGAVSLQVLQEYFVAATRKLGLDAGLAREKVEAFARFDVGQPGLGDVLAAIDSHRLRKVSYWDALILRMATQTGCSVLLSEDMQHGQVIDGLRIVNPFL